MKSVHDAPTLTLIANPTAGGGRVARLIGPMREAIQSRWSSTIELCVTSRRGDAFRRASRPALEVPRVFAVLGGDGTIQEVANGLMMQPFHDRRMTSLGVLNAGTGRGLAQSMRLPKTLDAQADVIARGLVRDIDVGHVRVGNGSGTPVERFFVNECQAGIGGDVVRRVETTSSKRLGGRATFGLSAVRAAWSHPNEQLWLEIDGCTERAMSILGLVVGNGDYTGGGMNLTPGAVLWDGNLDLLIMKAQSFAQRLLNLSKIYSARHVHVPEFELHRVRRLSARSPEGISVEADGEYLGRGSATITIVPRALRVTVPEVWS